MHTAHKTRYRRTSSMKSETIRCFSHFHAIKINKRAFCNKMNPSIGLTTDQSWISLPFSVWRHMSAPFTSLFMEFLRRVQERFLMQQIDVSFVFFIFFLPSFLAFFFSTIFFLELKLPYYERKIRFSVSWIAQPAISLKGFPDVTRMHNEWYSVHLHNNRLSIAIFLGDRVFRKKILKCRMQI